MGDAAAATTGAPPAAPSTTAPAAAAPAAPAAPNSAGMALVGGPDWVNGFKNEEVKTYVSQKGFKTTEDLATSFYNLEKMKGVPEERLLKLPEKMEGDEARAVWERLGAPKDPAGYEIPRDEKTDVKFTESMEGIFHKNNLTKTQAHGVVKAYNEMVANQMNEQRDAQRTALAQGDEALKKEWGGNYDQNINIAKAGVKALGLDAKTLDLIEATQGRAQLFKMLQRVGVSVGESNFVDGTNSGTSNQTMTPEKAQQEITALTRDKGFGQKLLNGDKEAMAKWTELNKLAAPGEKSIG